MTAAELLALPWRPDGEPGVILADVGQDGPAACVLTVDPHRDAGLSDEDAAALAAHLITLHNAALAAKGRGGEA
ncbi:hypothetical protein [Azospirillum sp. ST 5-10]|uniref:hypothetical protein n=1 Tax=unclassified Azospirillum TaxID=2630922 RepID=UPI003F49BCC7